MRMNLRKTLKKILLILILMLMIILQSTLNVKAETSEEAIMGIIWDMGMDEGNKIGYSINTPGSENSSKIWRIVKYKSSALDSYENISIYCVKAETGFSTASQPGTVSETYDVFYDMRKEKDQIATHNSENGIFSGLVNGVIEDNGKRINRYEALLAIIDMLYLPESANAGDKQELLDQIIEYAKTKSQYSRYTSLMKSYPLTDSDIMAVQQAAIWFFTNYGENEGKYDQREKNGWLNYSNDGNTYDSLTNYNPESDHNLPQASRGQARTYQAELLYNYLIEKTIENAEKGLYSDATKEMVPVSVDTTNETLKYKAEGSNYVIGPIHISKVDGYTKSYDLDFTVFNNGQKIENYTILNDSQSIVEDKNVKNLVGKDFYISVPKTSAENIKMSIKVDYKKRNMALWGAQRSLQEQPLVIPKAQDGTFTVDLEVAPKELDLALRKYITQINGEDLQVSEKREPVIEEITQGKTTATYKHRKDPLKVETNNKVTYKLTIYNEGGKVGRATKIVDQLPTGLKFVQVKSGHFIEDPQHHYDAEGENKLYLVRDGNTDNLQAYTGGVPASETIEIECQVTAVAGQKEQILTNVAWISEEIDGVTGETITNQPGKDRDSEPSTTVTPTVTKDNMSDYTGKSTNDSSNLANKDAYFEGQQDDDDFEKLKLEKAKGSYELQITKVDADNEETKFNDVTFHLNLPNRGVISTKTNSDGVATVSELTISEPGTENIIITEVEAPEGYKKITKPIQIQVKKELINGEYKATEATLIAGEEEGCKITLDGGIVKLTVPNKKISGSYQLQIEKVDSQNNDEKLENAKFTVNIPTRELETITTNEQGIATTSQIPITATGTEDITIQETVEPSGYKKLMDSLTIRVDKAIVDDSYQATGARITSENNAGCEVSVQNGIIKLKVPNKKIEGNYNLKIIKEDSENNQTKLQGASFTVNIPNKQAQTITTGSDGIAQITQIPITSVGTESITIEETVAPKNYRKLMKSAITIQVEKTIVGDKYEITNAILQHGDSNISNVHLNGDTIEITVKNEKLRFDLALRKFIVAVSYDEIIEDSEYLKNEDDTYTREPVVDTSKLNTEDENGETITTATYNHAKEPLEVRKNDYVIYMLRAYNEGEMNGYAAEIKDHLPEYLEFVDGPFNEQYNWSVSEDGRTVTTTYLADKIIKKATRNEEGTIELDYQDVPIMCRIKDTAKANENITNIADITIYQDDTKQPIEDRDSEQNNVDNEEGNKPDYKDDEEGEYIPGQEDDDDFEKVFVKEFDLALRKFIAAVSYDETIEDSEYLKNEDDTYTREPVVDTSKLNTEDENGEKITTATYNHTKEPLEVRKNDYVIYMLRAYNEGEIDGYAAEIKDHLPEYLEFVDGAFNEQYKWSVSEDGKTVTTTYLADKLIKKATRNEEGTIELDYEDVPIMCRVKDTAKTNENITNIADITKYQDDRKQPVEDRDSEQNNVDSEEGNKPDYKDDEEGEYIPGQEDDDDFEKVVIKKFDLALRKFITKVNEKDVTTRIPQVSYTDGKITYEHDKTPVGVAQSDTVIYTIRVFNEGELNGYASKVSDDIPEGLEFLPENDTNKDYRWVMWKELEQDEEPEEDVKSDDIMEQDGKTYVKTTNAKEADIIVTDYLSMEQGKERMGEDDEENPALLKAFNPDAAISDTNPDYKDLKVAFKVTEPNSSDRIIVNKAQITDDTDENGNPIDDEDSKPGEWNEGEDDQDKEYLEVQEFDLALRKWVTQAIVIENGKETVTQTGHKPYDDPEDVVKVEIHRNKLNKVTVKFRYKIRVTNEGDIEGYAKEITDYVPNGLKFVAKDNPDWKDEGNNVISTRLLENTLLKPGEYAEVEVLLTWVNGQSTMGVMTNTAEISEDYNERNVPDKDSTPDNKKPKEDDIDDAPVMLSIGTGKEATYFALGLTVLVTLAGGIILIKKHVL